MNGVERDYRPVTPGAIQIREREEAVIVATVSASLTAGLLRARAKRSAEEDVETRRRQLHRSRMRYLASGQVSKAQVCSEVLRSLA